MAISNPLIQNAHIQFNQDAATLAPSWPSYAKFYHAACLNSASGCSRTNLSATNAAPKKKKERQGASGQGHSLPGWQEPLGGHGGMLA